MNDFLANTYDKNKEKINNPKWNEDSTSWEWKVPEPLEQRWSELSEEIKAAIYLVAQYAIESEPWHE